MRLAFASFSVFALAVISASGCVTQPLVTCTGDTDCPGGMCLPSPRSNQRFCANVWPPCPSGLRWAPEAADDLSRRCVGDEFPDLGPSPIDLPFTIDFAGGGSSDLGFGFVDLPPPPASVDLAPGTDF